MNNLVKFLLSNNSFNEKELKRLYRSLSKEIHPDKNNIDGEGFIRLHNEYLDALETLKNGIIYKESNKVSNKSNDYSIVFNAFSMINTKNYKRYFEMALFLLKEHNIEVLESYKKVFSILERKNNKYVKELIALFSLAAAIVRDNKYNQFVHNINIFNTYSNGIEKISLNLTEQEQKALTQVNKWLSNELLHPF